MLTRKQLYLFPVTSAISSSVIFFGLYRESYKDTKVGWSAITFTCGWCVIFLAQLPRLRYYHLPEPANILLARKIVLISTSVKGTETFTIL